MIHVTVSAVTVITACNSVYFTQAVQDGNDSCHTVSAVNCDHCM